MVTTTNSGEQPKHSISSYPQRPTVGIPTTKRMRREPKYVRIPLAEIQAASLRSALALCRRFMPQGGLDGDCYNVFAYDYTTVLEIDIRTGEWASRLTNEKGSDIPSLFAWLCDDSDLEAAAEALALVLAFSAEVGDE
jgi:hypothetical protein